jgi:hypothetical protein
MLLSLAFVPQARAERLTVCAFSFHGPDEIQVFKDALPAGDFEVLDLSPHLLPAAAAAPASGDGPNTSWLFGLCRPDLHCDMVVYSAEFAGRFFGSYGVPLGLADMEEASCQARCDGLFHTPREVFLLACNTLATKDQDQRTPADYLEVLLAHGFDRATAERVVETRYGALGPSFRQALRRVFSGVPLLYGFSSVAPSGKYTAPLLERYLRAKGNYRRWLEGTAHAGQNGELLTAFRGTGLVQTNGLVAGEPAAADRDLVCRLYDEHTAVEQRLRAILQIMNRPDFLAFLPTIQVFINRHPPDTLSAAESAVFEEIRRCDDARQQVLRLVDELGESVLQLELAHTARHLGWMTREDFDALALRTAHALMRRPLTSEVVDIMCEIPRHVSLRNEFDADDLSVLLYAHAEGIRLITCINPADPRVGERLASSLEDPNVSIRVWAAYALSERVPLDDATLVRLAWHLRDPSAEVRRWLRWIFATQAPLSPAVHEAVAALDPELAKPLPTTRRPRRRWWSW